MLGHVRFGPWSEPRLHSWTKGKREGLGLGLVVTVRRSNWSSIHTSRGGMRYDWYKRALLISVTTPRKWRQWVLLYTGKRSNVRAV